MYLPRPLLESSSNPLVAKEGSAPLSWRRFAVLGIQEVGSGEEQSSTYSGGGEGPPFPFSPRSLQSVRPAAVTGLRDQKVRDSTPFESLFLLLGVFP